LTKLELFVIFYLVHYNRRFSWERIGKQRIVNLVGMKFITYMNGAESQIYVNLAGKLKELNGRKRVALLAEQQFLIIKIGIVFQIYVKVV